ncbi:MAG: hypothetical protein ACK57R_01870 [Dolichospermum sp.]|jgi:hypothetical protein
MKRSYTEFLQDILDAHGEASSLFPYLKYVLNREQVKKYFLRL